MGSIFSELFNNWVNAFEQEEGKKKPIHLPNAKENYRETAKYQMMDYIKKVDAAKKRGKEYCDLVSSEPYPMRQEQIDYFLKKGYDIYWSVLDLETGPAYYYKAVWTEDAIPSTIFNDIQLFSQSLYQTPDNVFYIANRIIFPNKLVNLLKCIDSFG